MDSEAIKNDIRDKISISCSRSSGPGGQNVNKRDTKVTMHLNIESLKHVNKAGIARIKRRLSSRINSEGCLVIHADGERSQARNREDAFERMENLIFHALRPDPEPRKKTLPGRAARERRIVGKKKRSRIKKERGKVSLTTNE